MLVAKNRAPVTAYDWHSEQRKNVEIIGLNTASAHMHERLSGHLGGGH